MTKQCRLWQVVILTVPNLMKYNIELLAMENVEMKKVEIALLAVKEKEKINACFSIYARFLYISNSFLKVTTAIINHYSHKLWI